MNIEALKEAHDLSLDGRDFAARQIILDVIANLEKEALMSVPDGAQPSVSVEQEPVAWRIRCTDPMRDWVLMYRRPKTEEQFSNMEIQPLYTTPPQRKPMTSSEIRKWWASENGFEDCNMAKIDDFEQVIRAVEGKHGIKENT